MTDNSSQIASAFPEAQLIPVFHNEIGGRTAQVCDARTLHAFLQVKRDFSTWINERINKYKFVENKDFTLVSQFSPNLGKIPGGRGRPSTEYFLCLDMAKELSMVENNEQGRQARRYFIAMERRALEQSGQIVPPNHLETLLPTEQALLSEIVQHKIAPLPTMQQSDAGTEIWSRLHCAFRVPHYNQLARTQLSAAILYVTAMTLPKSQSHSNIETSQLTTAIHALTIAIKDLTGQLATRSCQEAHQSSPKPQIPMLALPFLAAWWQCLGERDMTATDLCQVIKGQQCPILTQSALEFFGPVEKLTSRRLGNAFRNWSQHTLDGLCLLNKGKTQGSVIWRLERIQ